MPPVSRLLAEALAAAERGSLPADAVAEAERAVLDWLGSALAGARQPAARMIYQVALGWGDSHQATFAGGGRGSAAAVALANGAAAHVLELDDLHQASTVHAGAPVVAAALAAAERQHASGAAFLHAVVMGYEAALRIGEAVNPSHYRFWHPTGTVATFGAAAAAASLLGLDATGMLAALGSAGTQAAGLWEFNADGAMSKPLHAGKAAMNGVLAADLAARGLTGAARILEGERGFFAAFSEAADAAKVTSGLGTRWKIRENSYKMHACCGHTHTAIDAALELRPRLGTDGVAAIEIATYGPGFAIVNQPRPATPAQARFSLAYAVAAALRYGQAGLDQFSEAALHDAAVEDLLGKTRVTVSAELTARYPAAWPCRLVITLGDGTRLAAERDLPEGHPQRPVSLAILREKFLGLVAPVLGDDRARAYLRALERLPGLGDMAGFFRGV